MMKRPANKPLAGMPLSQPLAEAEVWIVSENPALVERIQALLRTVSQNVCVLPLAELEKDLSWPLQPNGPLLIVIDIGRSMNWGQQVIQRVRRARIRAPMVVLTEEFSMDFGAKIISEGIRYYFSRDFCDMEFIALTKSLLDPASTPQKHPGHG